MKFRCENIKKVFWLRQSYFNSSQESNDKIIMSSTKCQLLHLPIELFAHICDFLTISSLCQLEETSRTVQESLEEAGVWRRKAEQCGAGSNFTFVKSMLEHVRVKKLKDASVFKVIVGGTMIVKELCFWISKRFFLLEQLRWVWAALQPQQTYVWRLCGLFEENGDL